MKTVLIVDDEESICWGLERVVRGLGHQAVCCASAEQALRVRNQHRFDLGIFDVRLPGTDGLSLARTIRNAGYHFPIIVITAYGDLATAVQAVQTGAYEYIIKPFNLSFVEGVIEKALCHEDVPDSAAAAPVPSATIVGSSPAIQEVFKRIALVAPTEASVHLHGESGTGKEMVARAIHEFSPRKDGPFVVIHAAAINTSLAESELFGHIKGSFTGAEQNRVGLISQANGGTLFFDEVADIPMELQIKLLRAIEYGEFIPVGGVEPIRSQFRVISATHRQLRKRVEEGLFREDLYFRLMTFRIDIPPLRERGNDIVDLADYFLSSLSAKTGEAKPRLSEEARAELFRRQWSGNVRELRNAIEHALVVARSRVIQPEHLPPPEEPLTEGELASLDKCIQDWARAEMRRDPTAADLHSRFLEFFEHPLFEAVLQQNGGRVNSAARILGMHRVTLSRKLDEYRTKRAAE